MLQLLIPFKAHLADKAQLVFLPVVGYTFFCYKYFTLNSVHLSIEGRAYQTHDLSSFDACVSVVVFLSR